MKLSHSKLNCILNNPAEYYLIYKEQIKPKEEKPALSIGSAVHWGIEHNTCDLTEYYEEINSKRASVFNEGQSLAEAMVYGYLNHKEEIFKDILYDKNEKKEIQLIDEEHEVTLEANLNGDTFLGIIDLLLITDKGFIIIDYKTSSRIPDWDNYLEQVYRYVYLLEQNFPDIPVYKIGIINIRKTMIRKKKNENEIDFKRRMEMEYEINDESYINYHEYEVEKLNRSEINSYINNLKTEAQMANYIEDKGLYFINYSGIEGVYGKSEYWDIYKKVKDCYIKYDISDEEYILNSGKVETITRDCVDIDTKTIFYSNVLNKYNKFKKAVKDLDVFNKKDLFKTLKKDYITDENLLEKYYNNYMLEIKK